MTNIFATYLYSVSFCNSLIFKTESREYLGESIRLIDMIKVIILLAKCVKRFFAGNEAFAFVYFFFSSGKILYHCPFS